MSRTRRLLVPHLPHHIVQRGHNRASVFFAAEDYRRYLDTLSEWKNVLELKVYAYCLMTNHVHLLIEPGEDTSSVGKLMRRLAGRHTRYVNALAQRTGTLWEGRYKASPVQTDHYLLACSRYIELNPVRANLVTHPGEYPWSSYSLRVSGSSSTWLDMHPCHLAFGSSSRERASAYVEFVAEGTPMGQRLLISRAVRRNQLTGDGRFVDQIERLMGRRFPPRRPGRPRGGSGDL